MESGMMFEMESFIESNLNKIKYTLLISICCYLFLLPSVAAGASELLTEEEKAFIADNPIIKTAFIHGAAPIAFIDSKGQVQGISKRVIDEISSMTGLSFEYVFYNSVEELITSDSDIICGIPPNYAPEDMILSKPLTSETILYINSSLDSQHLDDKIYAAVEGSQLPEGIKEERTIYFKNRKESLDAVEKGYADYGYGNAYSVAFYIMQNDYKNIITIPQKKETREYCIGFINNDPMLISIINKSLDTIDNASMQSIILDVASSIERKITLGMIMNIYGNRILIIVSVVFSILLFIVISNIRTNKKLKMQNKRYEALAHTSNECIYEYQIKNDQLKVSEKFSELFGIEGVFDEAVKRLKSLLSNQDFDDKDTTIELPMINNKTGIFKIVNTNIYSDQGKRESIIGKLIDISDQVAEKEALIIKSQVDRLTNLYNASTVKEYIMERINNIKPDTRDIFLLVDFDDFKAINDTHGHLIGDKILANLGSILKRTFRNSDIIGCMGGDEFTVYLEDISSIETIKEKCNEINSELKKAIAGVNPSVSIGMALVEQGDKYEDVYIRADKAYIRQNTGENHSFIVKI